MRGLKKPGAAIFVGESGTTLRLLLGVLAGQDFAARLVAAKSLSGRPMLRVNSPLRLMGAAIRARGARSGPAREEYPPLSIRGGALKPVIYRMPVASAQVKSAILLAGLYAPGETAVIEQARTRDHTERMLKVFRAVIKRSGNRITVRGGRELRSPGEIFIPGDISSAAFFVVLTSVLADSELKIKNIGLNPTRTGAIKVLKRMGARIRVLHHGAVRAAAHKNKIFEPMGDLLVSSSSLKGTSVKKEEIPSLIDELPILMVAACFAKGRTVFSGVEELRVKEADRIKSMCSNLNKMGADIEVVEKKGDIRVIVNGVKGLKGAFVKSFGDHRTAMSMVIAGLKAQGETAVDDVSCIDKSFPSFLRILKSLIS